MMKLGTVFAIAFAAVALIATTTYGHRQPTPAQISPLSMMNDQHLPQTEMVDFSLVF